MNSPTNEPDTLDVTATGLLDFADSNPDLARRLNEAVGQMGGFGLAAEAEYRAAIARLMPSTREATAAVRAKFAALPNDRYLDRWSLVQLLVDLLDVQSLAVFEQVLAALLPDEPVASCEPSAVVAVSVLQATALEGVRRLAALGEEAALGRLRLSLRHDNPTVRRIALDAFLELGGPDALATALNELPEEEAFLVDQPIVRGADIEVTVDAALAGPEVSVTPARLSDRDG